MNARIFARNLGGGRIVQDGFWDTNERPRPWITDDGDGLTGVLLGQAITSFELAKHSLTVGFCGLTLSIEEAPEGRPILEGSILVSRDTTPHHLTGGRGISRIAVSGWRRSALDGSLHATSWRQT